MKKLLFLLTIVLAIVITLPLSSQVSFTTDGSDPDASAMLDVKSTTSGMLVPRMTEAERDAINGGTFATGLIIYQTNNSPGFYYYDGAAWQKLVAGDDGDWAYNGNDIYSTNSGNVGIGTSTPVRTLHVNGHVAFGTEVTAARAIRSLNLIANNAVMRVWRVTDVTTLAPAVELIWGTQANAWEEGNLWWDFYLNAADGSFNIRDRMAGVSGENRLLIDTLGNIGVGTNTPTQDLHVSGNMRLTGSLYDAVNSPGTSGQFLQSSVTGVYWVDASSTDDGDWTLSGNDMYNSNTGNVGIGNPTPSNQLSVGGDADFSGDVSIGTTSPATGLLIYQTDGVSGFYFYNGSKWVLFDSWHGSTTRIKITPMDFQTDDPDDNLDMDQQGRWCRETGSASPVLTMAIPTGYKATHVMIYGEDSNNSVTVRANEITNGTTNTSLGTGNVNTEINITDLNSTNTNYISIYINLGNGDEVYGGYITIDPL